MTDISHYTEKRADHFIQHILLGHGPVTAAEAIGVCRATVYNWRKRYPEFAERWEHAVGATVDFVEEVVYRQALGGNLQAAFFWLRAHKPEVYDRPALARLALMNAALSARSSGKITISVDENGIPQLVENNTNPVRIYMPDNGRSKLIDQPPEPEQPAQEAELTEPSNYLDGSVEVTRRTDEPAKEPEVSEPQEPQQPEVWPSNVRALPSLDRYRVYE